VQLELEVMMLILVVAVVLVGAMSVIAGRIGVAAPLLLTVLGAGIGFIPGMPMVEIEPEVFLSIILPPLLYAAARHVPFVDFRRSLRVIALLAIGAVVVSAFAVGFFVNWLWPAIPLSLAIGLGAVVAPPDAVAATAIGKRLGLPKRDVTILEGEALCNDATALVLLSLSVQLTLTGGEFHVSDIVTRFIWAVVSAVLIGGVVGIINVRVRGSLHDRILDIALAMVTPFLAFLLTEIVHGSGIVAVVVAGLIVGNEGAFRIPGPQRTAERANWDTFSHLVENGAFLYLGYRLPFIARDVRDHEGDLWGTIGMGLAVCLLLVLIRMAIMPLLVLSIRNRARSLQRRSARGHAQFERIKSSLGEEIHDERVSTRLRRFGTRLQRHEGDLSAEQDEKIGWKDGLLIGWAGMRGVVTVVAVETLPRLDAVWWERLVLVASVVAVVTLLVQGLTLAPLARALNATSDESTDVHDEVRELYDEISSYALIEVERTAEKKNYPRSVVEPVYAIVRGWRQRYDIAARGTEMQRREEITETLELTDVLLDEERRALRYQRSLGAHSSEAIKEALHLIDSQQRTRTNFIAGLDADGEIEADEEEEPEDFDVP